MILRAIKQLPRFSVETALILLILGPAAARTDDVPFRIGFSNLHCVEETDEVGADEPSFIIFVANLRTGKSGLRVFSFAGVDQHETHYYKRGQTEVPHASVLLAEWLHVKKADDIVILVLLMESDVNDYFGPGETAVEHVWNSVKYGNRYGDSLRDIVQQNRNDYSSNGRSRQTVVDALTAKMRLAFKLNMDKTANHLDLIGIGQLKIDEYDTKNAGQRILRKELSINGDGGQYRLRFAAASGPRSIWEYSGGHFKRTSGEAWAQHQNERKLFTFKEAETTVEYVELFDPNRKVTVRLYKDSCKIATNGQFATILGGHWAGHGGSGVIVGPTAVVPAQDKFGKDFLDAQKKLGKRDHWTHQKGYFTKTSPTGWDEYQNGRKAFTFVESNRTIEFVELTDANRNISVRLYAKKAQILNPKDFGTEWVDFYPGNWSVGNKANKSDDSSESLGGPSTAVDLSGKWESNVGVVYEIQQTGDVFTWSASSLNETAQGSLTGNDQLKVDWTGTFGLGSTNGNITQKDSTGKARRIQWDNGIVFNRQ